MNEKSWLNINSMKFCALIALSALLSVTTVVLGALPLLVARRAGGRVLFWSTQLVLTVGLVIIGVPFYALIILAQTLMIGLYVEIEEHGGSVFASASVAILAAVGAAVLTGGIWMQTTKLHLGEELRKQVEPVVQQLTSMNSSGAVPGGSMTTESVLQQLPSAAIIALILSLAIALIGKSRLNSILKLGMSAPDRLLIKAKLLSFRLPDWMVWVVVAAIAGAFLKHGKHGVELASVNALNVLVILYFFQGLAVISNAFRVYKVGAGWQAVWYVLLVLQLFLMVSLLGFADYWLEFRERLNRKPAETKRSI